MELDLLRLVPSTCLTQSVGRSGTFPLRDSFVLTLSFLSRGVHPEQHVDFFSFVYENLNPVRNRIAEDRGWYGGRGP